MIWQSFLALLVLLALLLRPERVARAAPLDEPDDDELARRAQGGDRTAFNRLVGRHQSLAFNVAYRTVGDAERAADATQEAFLSAYRRLDSYHGGNFRAWLMRVVKNQCFDLMRYEKRRPTASLDAMLVLGEAPTAAVEHARPEAPDEAVLRAEMAAWLQQALMQLPHDQRMTLVMADVQGFSYEEIASAMETELGTVKSRLFRARRRVRDLLQANEELLPAAYRLTDVG